MSRFRLLPTCEQEKALLAHCRDARFAWNLAVEQQKHWRPGRKAPGYVEQCAHFTEARAEYSWLRAGSQTGGMGVKSSDRRALVWGGRQGC